MEDLKKQVQDTVSSAVLRIDDTKHQLDNIKDTLEHTHPILKFAQSISFAAETAENSVNKAQLEISKARDAYNTTRAAFDPIIEFSRLHPIMSSLSVSMSVFTSSLFLRFRRFPLWKPSIGAGLLIYCSIKAFETAEKKYVNSVNTGIVNHK